MNFGERTITFSCNGNWLYGVLSLPESSVSRGVVIVVGGPQYRVGSHRQFTLLARHLAAHGVPVLRFDYRGMGDSEGDVRTFEDLDDDLRSAIDGFLNEVPSVNEVVIWGLCDAASAALFYSHQDKRVTGLVLLNPWVRTDEGAAKVYLKHYYVARLFEPRLWSKILQGRFNYSEAAQSFLKTIGTVLKRKKSTVAVPNREGSKSCDRTPLPQRMFTGLSCFEGRLLLITSGNDLTAQEFLDMVRGSPEWQQLLASPRVSRLDLPEATHTFSRREWRDQVAAWTKDWIRSW
ncbi:hydrolase 1, exosortase A system-associated [Nitrosospira lacus]|uniref:Hydrolase 1, exosortase A system-associated n=1 Tax=Nitrosospira lacus TaxID=1288494 RepID=A0A1W6SL68_9PROT|nr:hydrolase 1, exosortase A system-associated [Nitrosospira lacus]ARO86534.1 hydrolase 1, exosortase A system-associated [Nitrosospira lacus]